MGRGVGVDGMVWMKMNMPWWLIWGGGSVLCGALGVIFALAHTHRRGLTPAAHALHTCSMPSHPHPHPSHLADKADVCAPVDGGQMDMEEEARGPSIRICCLLIGGAGEKSRLLRWGGVGMGLGWGGAGLGWGGGCG